MIIILTEDSTSGFKFYKLLKDILFSTSIAVFNTSYGSNTRNAGNSKFLKALQNLIKDGKLNSGDTVFFAVDNLIVTKPEMQGDYRALRAHLYDCYNFLDSLGILHYTSSYVCIEEVILSFKLMEEFVTPYKRTKNAYLSFYIKHKNLFQKFPSTQEYLKIFQRDIANGKTVEKSLHTLLLNVSGENDFNMFKINKSDIGPCWYTDCSSVRKRLAPSQLKICNTCYCANVLNDGISGFSKLKCLYEQSNFVGVLKDLNLKKK